MLRSECVTMFEFVARCFELGFDGVEWNGDSLALGRAGLVLLGVAGRACTLGLDFEHSIYVCLN